MNKLLFLFGFLLMFGACKNQSASKFDNVAYDRPEWLRSCNKKLQDVIVIDIFTPPVGSRIFAYANIAAYEVLVHKDSSFLSLSRQLNGLDSIPQPDLNSEYCYDLASLIAFCTVAKKMVYSEYEFTDFMKSYIEKAKNEIQDTVLINNSVSYGTEVGKKILAWSKKDNFAKSRTYERYILKEGPQYWKPTLPEYMDAIEPYWNTIRPMVLDSAAQFKPAPPAVFDSTKGSVFYNLAKEVYDSSKVLTDEQLNFLSFWDDNCKVSRTEGHLKYFIKKTQPGGHWVSIASKATKMQNYSAIKTAQVMTITSIALMDGFISCWDEKFRSNLIRPITYINRYIDKEWKSVLQTPPFPEYTSGHSVISAAAATVLTKLVSDNFAFTDSTEYEYSLPVRLFSSFNQAANEAAISRLYGGIHYREAVVNGAIQGRKVGNLILQEVITSK